MGELWWILLAFILAGWIQGTLGFGFAVTSTLLLVNRIDFTMLVFLNLCMSFLTCLIAMLSAKNIRSVLKSTLFKLVISALAGLVIGLAVINYVDSGILKRVTLIVILVASVISLSKVGYLFSHSYMTWITGFLSGVLTPSTGINGPFVVLHLNAISKNKQQIRNTMLSYLLIIMASGIILMSIQTKLNSDVWHLLPKVAIPSVLGYVLGMLSFRLFSDLVFSIAVIFFLIISSLLSLIYLIV